MTTELDVNREAVFLTGLAHMLADPDMKAAARRDPATRAVLGKLADSLLELAEATRDEIARGDVA